MIRLYALTIIDNFTRFAVLVALSDKKEQTIVKALVKRVFGIFGPPETLHSDQGPKFDNKVMKQVQDVFVYKKTKPTPYRPHGNFVSERIHSTLQAMFRCMAILHRIVGVKSCHFASSSHHVL